MYTGADSVVYLSLEGLVSSITEGRDHTLAQSSNHFITTDDSVGPRDVHHVKLNSEECSSNGVCNGNTLQRPRSKGCSEDGYCIACLSGDYPVALDW